MLVFEKLEPAVHNRQQFSCGNEELDDFFEKIRSTKSKNWSINNSRFG